MQRKEHVKMSSMCGSTNQYANSQFGLHVDWKLRDAVYTRKLNLPVRLLIIQNVPHMFGHVSERTNRECLYVNEDTP
jgi:hypothetical protein